MSGTDKDIYSDHTFIFPFTWEINGEGAAKSYHKLRSNFDNNLSWSKSKPMEVQNSSDFESFREFYKEYQYFYPNVRKAIYEYDDDICVDYCLKGSEEGKYHIYKGEKRYCLNINAIKLRLVNTGVALFIMECEYHNNDGKGQIDISTIKEINEYGRRITLPYIDPTSNICADKLEVDIPGVETSPEDYKVFISHACKEKKSDLISLEHISNFIKELLSYNGKYTFVSHKPRNNNEVLIRAVLDDRMYVAFAVTNKDITKQVSEEEGGEYSYLKEDQLNRSLYEIAYIDLDGKCSCPDRKRRLELLDKALYKRWMPCGTFYTITPMGFGMLTSADRWGELKYLYENFNSCYKQMVYSAVVQRASIVMFNREAADIAKHFSDNKHKVSRKDINTIMYLQERHTAFDNQLFFSEVSSEQQASEMYDMLKSSFLLEKENEKLDLNLTSLYEITDTNLNSIVNRGVEFLTWVSIILSGGALVYSILFASDVILKNDGYEFTGNSGVSIDYPQVIFLSILFVLSIITFLGVRRHNRR